MTMREEIIALNDNDLTDIVGGSLGGTTIAAGIGAGVVGDLFAAAGGPAGAAGALAYIAIYELITSPPPEYSGVATALGTAVGY